ncbi:hypothetical protein ACIRJS_16565 [Streptomyces sp. NPDC102340]|uniref:hypothetical protein n=1 Tax=unclassified Streptomyces TaxID=2593676 RepID=UPI0038210C53
MAQAAVLAIRIVGNTRDAQAAIKATQKDLKRLQASLKATGKAFALASAGKALAAALAPVAGAAASAGVALGAFGLAAAGQIKQVSDASAAYKKYTDAQADAAAKKVVADKLTASGSDLAGKAQKQYQTALLKVATTQEAWKQSAEGMPKATQGTAIALAQLKTAYEKWSNAMAPTVMPLFTQALNIAKGALSGLTPLVTAAAGAIKPFLDRIQGAVQSGAFANWAKEMAKIGGPVLKSVLNGVASIGAGFASLMVKLGPSSKKLGQLIDDLAKKFQAWAEGGGGDAFAKMAEQAVPVLGQLITAVIKITTAFSPFGPLVLQVALALAQLVNALPTGVIQAATPAILAFVAAWRIVRTVMVAARLALLLTTAATLLNTAATEGNTVATRAMAVATRTAAIAQRVLNVAMKANMIGIVITAIMLLVAAVILAYKKSSTFRGIVQSLWGVMKSVGKYIAGAFVAAFHALMTAVNWVIKVVKSVISWFKKIYLPAALGAIKAAFKAIRTAAGWVIDKVKSVINWLKKIALPAALSKIEDAFNAAKTAAGWLVDKIKSVINWMKKIPGGGLLSKAIDKLSAPNPTVSVQRSLAATRAVGAPSNTVRGTPNLNLSSQIFVSIDGQQLQGRITKTVNQQMRADGARLRAGSWA